MNGLGWVFPDLACRLLRGLVWHLVVKNALSTGLCLVGLDLLLVVEDALCSGLRFVGLVLHLILEDALSTLLSGFLAVLLGSCLIECGKRAS